MDELVPREVKDVESLSEPAQPNHNSAREQIKAEPVAEAPASKSTRSLFSVETS
jgi:hypothetical protein